MTPTPRRRTQLPRTASRAGSTPHGGSDLVERARGVMTGRRGTAAPASKASGLARAVAGVLPDRRSSPSDRGSSPPPPAGSRRPATKGAIGVAAGAGLGAVAAAVVKRRGGGRGEIEPVETATPLGRPSGVIESAGQVAPGEAQAPATDGAERPDPSERPEL